MKINPDEIVVNAIHKALARSGGYCPCSKVRTTDMICPCKHFRETNKCCCGLYVDDKENNGE